MDELDGVTKQYDITKQPSTILTPNLSSFKKNEVYQNWLNVRKKTKPKF